MNKGKKNVIVFDIKQAEVKEPDSAKKNIKRFIDLPIFCIAALVIGFLAGAVDAVFGRVLLLVSGMREANPMMFIPFLAPAGILIYFIYDRFGKETQSGMKLLFERAKNNRSEIKLRLIPFVTLSTWLTHLFGGSAGREGVAVQIGGTMGSFIAQRLKLSNKSAAKILTITGMAAGFSGLFRTPMAAVFFASEVLTAGELEVDALLPSLIAAYTATIVSGSLGLEKFTFDLGITPHYSFEFYAGLCIAGIVFGILGGLFAFLMPLCKKFVSTVLKNPYVRIGVIGAAVSICSLLLFGGRYSGLGTNLINEALNGGQIFVWDFAAKIVFTIITLSAGYQGGEVTPLFSIGASSGVLIASLFGLPSPLFAALGYAAVFGSATNTLIAPILIGTEVFGFQYMPLFFFVCVLAYICNGNKSIYTLQTQKK